MSNKIIVLWGSLIIILVTVICYIAITKKEEIKFINLKQDLKENVRKYLKENDVELPFEITSEELEEKGYIEPLVLGNKLCAADIKVTKKIIFKKYDIQFTCIIKEPEDDSVSFSLQNSI